MTNIYNLYQYGWNHVLTTTIINNYDSFFRLNKQSSLRHGRHNSKHKCLFAHKVYSGPLSLSDGTAITNVLPL